MTTREQELEAEVARAWSIVEDTADGRLQTLMADNARGKHMVRELEAEVARLKKELNDAWRALDDKPKDPREHHPCRYSGCLVDRTGGMRAASSCDCSRRVLRNEIVRLHKIEAAAERLYDRWCNLDGELPEAEYFNALDEARKEAK